MRLISSVTAKITTLVGKWWPQSNRTQYNPDPRPAREMRLAGFKLSDYSWALAIAAGFYLALALGSYSNTDDSWSHSSSAGVVQNQAGWLGAWIADALLYLFGRSAWWWVLWLGLMGWRGLQWHWFGQRPSSRFKLSLGFSLLFLSSCSFEFVRLHSWVGSLPLGPGGLLGKELGSALLNLLGFSTTSVLLLLGLAQSASLLTTLSWLEVMERIGYGMERLWNWLQVRATARRQQGPSRLQEPQAQALLDDDEPFPSGSTTSPPPPNQLQPEQLQALLGGEDLTADTRMASVDELVLATPSPRAAQAYPSMAEPTWEPLQPKRNTEAEPDSKRAPWAEPAPSALAQAPSMAPLRAEPTRHTEPARRAEPMAAPPVWAPPVVEDDADELWPDEAPPWEEEAPPPARAVEELPMPWTSQHHAAPEEDEEDEPDVLIKHQPSARSQAKSFPLSPLPPLDLLDAPAMMQETLSPAALESIARLIERRLKEFGVEVKVVAAYPGPVITRYEIDPATGVKGSQIVNLMKDLARALSLISIRVVETIPGKTYMGLELPNPKRQIVRLSEVLAHEAYQAMPSHLAMAMGKDIAGKPVAADLAKMPHLLVAGTTGSGKSVAINAMILSLLYKSAPADVRLIMVDPKMLELSVYEGIPHLLAPVVTDMRHAANALNWCVGEMEKRYRLMSSLGVRNLASFNQKIKEAEAAGRPIRNPFSLTPLDPEPLDTLPLIVVVVDELADLMMVAGKKIEELIARLAQKARAAGIHLILATQRPSVDVITGLIKANIPTRVAFQVSSKIDSRTILDQMGAEALLGQGDMLFLPPGTGYPQRLHGAFVSDDEVHRVVEYLKAAYGEPQYIDGLLEGLPPEGMEAENIPGFSAPGDAETDPLYDDAVNFVCKSRRASISAVQRHLRIGYNRAARLIEQMEAAGLVSSMQHNGNRDVLIPARDE